MPRYNDYEGNITWDQALSEKGAIKNVIISAVIVLAIAVFIVWLGTKIFPKFKEKIRTPSQQLRSYLLASAALTAIGIVTDIPLLIVAPLMIFIVGLLVLLFPAPVQAEAIVSSQTNGSEKHLTYVGKELDFSEEIYTSVLTKYLPFYNHLIETEKSKFLKRLGKFISLKTFIIHDESGFREMPILISAAAIQLSFGFEKYLLPDFPNINIYPEEFLGAHPSIRYLEGNVSNSCINISWKHFLNGFKYPDDGQNVGLHEMAHAYHFQNFETGNHEDEDFTGSFPNFNLHANKAFAEESTSAKDLYTDYALRNFQEFWAESVEIFFEKPNQLKITYPELYTAMCDLLNQRPV